MVKPSGEWPQSTKPLLSNPPAGTVGIVLPIRDNLKFFKLAFHSILDFTDYRFMLTIVDNMSGFQTRQYLESIRRNHPVNVLQYQQPHAQGAEWNLGLRFMFAFANVQYGVVLTPDIVVEPNWLSRLVKTLNGPGDVGMLEPYSNLCLNHERLMYFQPVETINPFCAAFKRPLYEHLGGFSDALTQPGSVMTEFGNRAKKAGFRLFCDSEVYVHRFSRSGSRDSDVETKPAEGAAV